MDVVGVAAGAAGSNYLMSFASSLYAPLASGLPKAAGKAALAVLLSKFGKRMIGPKMANNLAIGIAASAVIDVVHNFIPAVSLGTYTPSGAHAFIPAQLRAGLTGMGTYTMPQKQNRTLSTRQGYFSGN
jgi:hypothetical protein